MNKDTTLQPYNQASTNLTVELDLNTWMLQHAHSELEQASYAFDYWLNRLEDLLAENSQLEKRIPG